VARIYTRKGDDGTTGLWYPNRASDALYAMARAADEPEPKLFEGRS
jgi:cob(I)alamin adenosyltransferase